MSYKDELYAQLWSWADNEHQGRLDGGRRDGRPPVLRKGLEAENVLVAPNSSHAEEVRTAIAVRDRHRWFSSLFSSQALAQSVFANIQAYDCLDILSDVRTDCGRPAFFQDEEDWGLELEYEMKALKEPRPTSVDVLFQNFERRIAVECKFTEDEFGTCSRTTLKESDEQYCNGNYEAQHGRKERCALTEKGILYWHYLPELFDWPADKDHIPCPFSHTYQLARNALAATLSPNGKFDPHSGHLLVVYDSRNPAFQAGGAGDQQWRQALQSCRIEGLLRRVSWQKLLPPLAETQELKWLADALERKYGFSPS